jgi:hypothetical protein
MNQRLTPEATPNLMSTTASPNQGIIYSY